MLAVLAANMPRLKALKRLEEVDAGALLLHPDYLFDLVMAAGLGEKVANAYRVGRIKADWKSR